jgi:hypothetical protein
MPAVNCYEIETGVMPGGDQADFIFIAAAEPIGDYKDSGLGCGREIFQGGAQRDAHMLGIVVVATQGEIYGFHLAERSGFWVRG